MRIILKSNALSKSTEISSVTSDDTYGCIVTSLETVKTDQEQCVMTMWIILIYRSSVNIVMFIWTPSRAEDFVPPLSDVFSQRISLHGINFK